ncbi:uncharacterized protein EHS24_008653 [Apiotrichum porosum]|uniref:Uncharacterized protein n=1 Tax=Apiotrichum porosum TaxID=105984 RepID=A0A427XQT2_9TREE|nr:uncharacterized protein EHS24_008653 [Apiotrichum porosum]RSH81216.1 hypothetical protein EHS24_008653 [Apiotrichum porosum]
MAPHARHGPYSRVGLRHVNLGRVLLTTLTWFGFTSLIILGFGITFILIRWALGGGLPSLPRMPGPPKMPKLLNRSSLKGVFRRLRRRGPQPHPRATAVHQDQAKPLLNTTDVERGDEQPLPSLHTACDWSNKPTTTTAPLHDT